MVDTLITAAAPLLGVAITLWFTNRREESRLRQERFFKLREDRKHLYVALAKETDYIHVDKEHGDRVGDLFTEIQLLTDDKNLVEAARRLIAAWDRASERVRAHVVDELMGRPSEHTEAGDWAEARTNFIKIARTELVQSADLDANYPERPSWWRRMFGA
jgi:hypothetical protein